MATANDAAPRPANIDLDYAPHGYDANNVPLAPYGWGKDFGTKRPSRVRATPKPAPKTSAPSGKSRLEAMRGEGGKELPAPTPAAPPAAQMTEAERTATRAMCRRYGPQVFEVALRQLYGTRADRVEALCAQLGYDTAWRESLLTVKPDRRDEIGDAIFDLVTRAGLALPWWVGPAIVLGTPLLEAHATLAKIEKQMSAAQQDSEGQAQ